MLEATKIELRVNFYGIKYLYEKRGSQINNTSFHLQEPQKEKANQVHRSRNQEQKSMILDKEKC